MPPSTFWRSDMRPNKLRELLKAGTPTLATHIHTTWPSIVEAIGCTGLYDYVEFVGEYGPYDLHDLDNLCRAAEVHNMSMMIKVDQEPRGFLAQRAIGSGFHSILFADCRSAADVQECVRIVRPETPEDGGTYGVATRRHPVRATVFGRFRTDNAHALLYVRGGAAIGEQDAVKP